MVKAHRIQVQRTAHYYTFGEASFKTEYFWLVTHGYGQLANQIIHKFDGFNPQKHLIVAPEGLNKFYWKRPQVGATWMTSAHRLDEIADYTAYLNGLYQQFISLLPKNVKIILFGFSQGCQTQIRWTLHTQAHFHHMILWAGLLPDDIDYKIHQAYFSDKQVHWIYGNDDEYLKSEHINWQTKLATKSQLPFSTHTFNGTHRIDRKVLHQLWASHWQ